MKAVWVTRVTILYKRVYSYAGCTFSGDHAVQLTGHMMLKGCVSKPESGTTP